MAFVSTAGVGLVGVRGGVAVSRRSAARAAAGRVRMNAAVDEDLSAARVCVDEGCEPVAVQDILNRLGTKREALKKELEEVEAVMGSLATANLGEDRSLVKEIMEAAIRIFSKPEDGFPKTGIPSPWTMDKPKKK